VKGRNKTLPNFYKPRKKKRERRGGSGQKKGNKGLLVMTMIIQKRLRPKTVSGGLLRGRVQKDSGGEKTGKEGKEGGEGLAKGKQMQKRNDWTRGVRAN